MKISLLQLLLKTAACGAVICAVLTGHRLAAQDSMFRGGRVGWARLETADQYWRRHSETDTRLSSFIRTRTSLNIDETWYTANVSRLDQLTAYPFIFANTLARVTDPADQRNLAEYLRRGGFLVVDACINRNINPIPEPFLADNTKIFKTLLPDCEIRELPADHEIYRCFFTMDDTPPHTYHRWTYSERWHRYGLQGVFVQDRLVSLITLSGLQCGWAGFSPVPDHHIKCMEMMLNIYVYALTR